MKGKFTDFIKNFSYTLTSNLIFLLISTLVILIIPKLIGVEDYGYWQLYLFYSSYVGFLHFGWNDGIYLRYGGKEYKELNKELFHSQFYMLIILQLILAVTISTVTIFLVKDSNKIFIFQMIAVNLFFFNIRSMLLFIMQGTNRIKEFALITIVDRVLYACLIIALLLMGVRDYNLLIVADLTGKLISLGYALYFCKDMVFCRISKFYFSFREAMENISVGIKLMFANIASMLIIGTVRFGIERSWDVVTFGKVSLTLSISNLLMIFINAVGIIMFPILRKTDEKNLPSIYVSMRDFLLVILLGVLMIYYPVKTILSTWLPDYAESLKYMALLFPMCVYEGKTGLLINTYLKTLRKEKWMLKINLVSLIFSLMFTFLTVVLLKNLDLAILSIVILLAFRSIMAEIILSKILGISVYKDIVLELMMTIIFIITAWFINSWLVFYAYVVAYIIYLVIKRRDIYNSSQNIKLMIKS